MTHKIAIVTFEKINNNDYHGDYDSCYSLVADTITEWQEVSDKEYSDLLNARVAYEAHHNERFIIIEQPKNQPVTIKKTINDWELFLKAEIEKSNKLATKRMERMEAASKKRREKLKNSKRKQLEKLKKELGEN